MTARGQIALGLPCPGKDFDFISWSGENPLMLRVCTKEADELPVPLGNNVILLYHLNHAPSPFLLYLWLFYGYGLTFSLGLAWDHNPLG